jgi:hypothetical protein
MSAGPARLASALLVAWLAGGGQSPSPLPLDKPKSPVVAVVGCAAASPEPHIWILSRAGARSESDHPGITSADRTALAERPLGPDTYQLIGVADFVDAETAARIGVRGKILSPSRMNTTGTLVRGHKVAVKGLLIVGPPQRINLTSVADLGDCR